MKSLALTRNWRLALDSAGNLATVDGPARIAQDVSTYERTFRGEVWLDQDKGIPYLRDTLGRLPQAELIVARANAAAREVPGVAEARTRLDGLEDRALRGEIRVTTEDGEVINVTV